MSASAPPRSLADHLRGWSDEQLGALLQARPDLGTPAPQDTGQLAARAAVRSSIQRAMDGLTRLELAVLEAHAMLGPLSTDQVGDVVNAAPEAIAAATERLTALALLWPAAAGLQAVSGVADALIGAPGGTGLRPATAGAPPAVDRLATVSEAARSLLAHVDAHGGVGSTAATPPTSGATAQSPMEELLAARLLVPREPGTVTLPGEVALALRAGRTTTSPIDAPPDLATSARDSALVERTAAGAAFETIRRVELLLDHWATSPPTTLRTGGLAVRDLKGAATLLHVEEGSAALLIEVAAEAGLLASGSSRGELVWLPTDAYDAWLARPASARWAHVVSAWLTTSRLPSLVGSRDADGGRVANALAPELSSVFAAETRRMALEVMASLPAGEVLAAGTGVASVVARLDWLRPRRPATTRAQQAAWAIGEAAELGLTGLGGVSAAGRAVLTGDTTAAAQTLEPLLPQPVDHLLLQADLTAVAPGPLLPAVAERLHLVADVESRGGATVYRFTPSSVRRAYDSGWSAGEIHAFLDQVSRTPVPQPLTYLVDDVGRTFGTLRLGHAEAFLRSDDLAALTELLHRPGASELGLRQIAPTVVVSTLPVELLLPRLRALGLAPVVESADGTVHIGRPDRQRTRTPKARRPAAAGQARAAAQTSSVVAALRAGDRAVSARPRTAATSSPGDHIALLRESLEAGFVVAIGYVDQHGTATERVVEPRVLDGGQLTAYDQRSDDVRVFALHRITWVRRLAPALE